MSDEHTTEVSFQVTGWPPTKNEASSMLAAGHPHAARVRALLETAAVAALETAWKPTADDISLELIVRGPTRPPSDATNYLGGIGDVLQNKMVNRGLDLTHLRELRAVALFLDDRQITEIRYRVEHAEQPSYTVSVRQLATPAIGTPGQRQW